MVVFYLRNSRIPDGKIVPVTVSLALDAVKNVLATGTGFPNLDDPEGEQIWILTLDTPESDLAGDPISTEIVNLVSKDTVHLEIEAALGRIGRQINWGTPLPDTQAPRLLEITPPLDQVTGVSIFSNIIARMQDPLPAAGVDLSTLNVRLNGFPIVTSGVAESGEDAELRGNVFDLTLIYRPKVVLT
jgi:hypothetical protein